MERGSVERMIEPLVMVVILVVGEWMVTDYWFDCPGSSGWVQQGPVRPVTV
jgi:hypothetical protein